MKLYSLYLFIFLILASCSRSSGQITIEPFGTGGEEFAFYYNNIWRERGRPYESPIKQAIAIETDFPIRVIAIEPSSTHKNGLNTSFVLYPNEKVSFARESSNLVMKISNDSIRNNELRFFASLNAEVGQYEGYMVDVYPKNWTIERRLMTEDAKYKKRLGFLTKYAAINKLSPMFTEYLCASFLYKAIFQKYDQLLNESEISDSLKVYYQNFNFPNSQAHWYLNEYADACAAYLAFKYRGLICGNCYSQQLDSARNMFDRKTIDAVTLQILNQAKVSKYDSLTDLARQAVGYVSNDKISAFINESYISSRDIVRKRQEMNPKVDIILGLDESLTSIPEFLERNRGKIIYLDFWASWCGPCRQAMPRSAALRDSLKGRDIVFAYVSIDDNIRNWRKANEKEGLNAYKDSYLFPNYLQSGFVKSVKLSTIPRYMIFDKTGNLIDADALKVEDPRLPAFLDRLIEK